MITTTMLGFFIGGWFTAFLFSNKHDPFLPVILTMLGCSMALSVAHFVGIGYSVIAALGITLLPIFGILVGIIIAVEIGLIRE